MPSKTSLGSECTVIPYDGLCAGNANDCCPDGWTCQTNVDSLQNTCEPFQCLLGYCTSCCSQGCTQQVASKAASKPLQQAVSIVPLCALESQKPALTCPLVTLPVQLTDAVGSAIPCRSASPKLLYPSQCGLPHSGLPESQRQSRLLPQRSQQQRGHWCAPAAALFPALIICP